MTRLQSVRDNWTEITDRLKNDKQELAQFLRFSAGMYKMSFPDAALIYHQNPNATKVAELSQWNKLGRLVNKGESSIPVFGKDNTCKHYFDISQTNGKRVPELWKLTDDLSADLTSVINEKYGKSCKNIQETIAAMSVDNIKARLLDMRYNLEMMKLSESNMKIYQQSVVSAVRYMVSSRSELDSDMKISGGINLNAADLFRDNRDLIHFCDLVQKSAKDTLLEIEREIIQILKQRREKSHEQPVQAQPDRAVSDKNAVLGRSTGDGNAQISNRQMGQAVATVDGNRVPNRSDSYSDDGQVADNSEGNRQRSREPFSGAGQAVSPEKSTSREFSRSSDLGKGTSADSRTSSDEGNSVSAERITVDFLIDKYNNADFNRRFDSYEYAGWILNDAKSTEFKLDAVAHFNKFYASDFSAVQAYEIKKFIETALRNRDISKIPVESITPIEEPIIIQNEVIETSSLPPLTDEKLIFGIIKHDEFMKDNKDSIAKFFDENQDFNKRTNYIKSIYNNDYTEFDVDNVRLGYKANENGLTVWEGNYLSRTKESGFSWDLVQSFTAELIDKGEYIEKPQQHEITNKIDSALKILGFKEKDGKYYADCLIGDKAIKALVSRTEENIPYITDEDKTYMLTDSQVYDLEQYELFRTPITHDINGYFADDLDEGDIIRLEGDLWTVVNKNSYLINLSNNDKTANNSSNMFFGRWQEILTKAGFEFVPEETRKIEEPIFAEPVPKTNIVFPEPLPQGEQLSLFGEPEPLTVAEISERRKVNLPSYVITQDMIDYVLKSGGNEPKSLLRICAQFQKDKTSIENADFLKKEFCTDGRGFKYVNSENTYTALVAAWYDKDGMTLGAGITAQNPNSSVHLSWEQVANRISELLKNGEFTSQDNIDKAAENELKDVAEKLWYLHQDYDGDKEYFVPEEFFKGGFPNSTAKITASLTDKNTLQKYIDGLTDLIKDYEQNRDTLRFHFHKPKEVLQSLKDLQLERKEFTTKQDFEFKPQFFITEDEIQNLLLSGSGIQDGKFHIDDFFKQEHTIKEKADFLKREYGDGGSGRSGFNTWHDSSGFSYSKGSLSAPDAKITMKWNEVAERIGRLVSKDKYITQADIDERIRNAKYTINNRNVDTDIDKVIVENARKVLERYGVTENETKKSPISSLIEKVKSAGILVEQQVTVNSPEKIKVTTKAETKSGVPVTYSFNSDNLVQGGAKTKFKANIEAIQTLQTIEAENRYATPEEQAVMAKYVGWGGIPQAFLSDRAADNIGGNLTNSAPTGWETEQQQLREILPPDEYKAARASTLTSFYTPPEVTDGVYQALSKFGFNGGNVLEPSMGVGNFFAKMPSDIRDNSKLYGVELDSISGRIAKQLYPQDKIQIKGFEQTNFNNNSFDVVVGNIPFGDYRVSDKSYDKHNFKIHDYFAAKAVDKVKPNGVVALVTSKFTMDKHNEKARRYLAERCDLLGAIRLPNNAFKQNAGTEVTTDILFLKKRETMTVEVPDWVHMSENSDGIPCNQYFVDNPDMVLGKMAWDERMKGKYGDDSKITACIADDNISLAEQIKKAVSKIEGKIETVRDNPEKDEREYIAADPSVRNFTHTIVDGNLYFRENEIMTKVSETGKSLDRMMGLHMVRQAAMAVIDAQADGCSDEELKKLQNDLNAVYDKFKKAYGNISDSVNERCFRQDDDYNSIAALEVIDSEKKTIEKAEIFSKRTIQPSVEITSVDTPGEALQVSIDRVGKVDIPYMAQLVGCEPEKIIADLGNDIFRNPAKIHEDEPFSGYEDASEYLSGNVREKLQIAMNYAKHIDSSFQKNADALKQVIPKDLEAGEISVRIGANWIDVEDYNKFLKEYAKANTGYYGYPVTRTKMGEYKIEGKYQDKSVAANETYGTSRMSSYHIFENLLNQRDVVIRDRKELDGKVYYEVNAKETQLAKEKARQMKEAFKSWIWEGIDRRDKYVEKYNFLFNAIRGREYDGSNQTFPGMNPAIKLRPHQENAILRAKLNGNTLLAHCVGAGKSFEMVAAAMEKKRLGLINKACIVVPKHLTLQMASEWMRLYPKAKLLVARPEDFEKNNRQKFIARCVTGDYDAVIMSFTQFERIPMSDQYRKQFMEKELNEIMDAIEDVDSTDRVSVKALERQKKQLEERLEKLLSSKKDNSLCFEKLGFDYLVCDEAHNYKNCLVTTKMSNVAGVQTTAAQKSEDMLMKTQYLNDKFGCNNILYATGTPINTL